MKQLIGITLALLLYTAVLLLPLPAAIGEAARFSRLLIIPIIAVVLYAAYAARRTWQTMLAPCATLVLFALPLAGLWSSGANEQNAIAGLIPYSDASGYYGDALRLLNGGDFLFTRRPLFPAMLTSLLWLSRQDLQVSLAILTALAAMGCYLAARALQRASGTTAAIVLLLLLFFYYRRFSGAALTEHLGVTLGCLSLALLLQAARKRSSRLALAGSFFAALALNARAGTFLFLPCLALWGGWYFGNKRRFSWTASGLIIAVIFVAFLTNLMLFTLFTNTDQPAFSNFSHTLYGLASGGKGWTQVMADHPEAANNPKTVYRLAYQMILSQPENLLTGILRSWRDFFVPVGQNDLFGFIAGNDSQVNNGIRLLLWWLTLSALIHLIHQRRNPVDALLLWGLPGIWLSIPFVPPIDADVMRAYAASMPFILVLPAIGVKQMLTLVNLRDVWEEDENYPIEKISLLIGGAVVALSIILPLGIGIFPSPPQRTNFDCPDGQIAINGYIPRGATVTLVHDGSNCGRLPAICFADFERQGMPTAPQQFEQLIQTLQTYPGNAALTVVFDHPGKHLFHILLPASWLPAPNRPFHLCVSQQPSGLDFYPITAENLLVQ